MKGVLTKEIIHTPSLLVKPVIKSPEYIALRESPSLITKAQRAAAEITRWIMSGAEIVPNEIKEKRMALCQECEFYSPEGNWGLGECRAPGCGCTHVKLFLAIAKCPHPDGAKWLPVIDK